MSLKERDKKSIEYAFFSLNETIEREKRLIDSSNEWQNAKSVDDPNVSNLNKKILFAFIYI